MDRMIEIDGSFGEGGGQILRTALSLSCLFRKPFKIFNVRKGRKKPGLMPQHLTAVKAAQLISDAKVEGDDSGSDELVFQPGNIRGGDFLFDVGTAGSTMLVLQTVVPALIFSGERSSLALKGGTHVPMSPSYHSVKEIFLPFLKRLDIHLDLSIESYGFYPKGGGSIRAELEPPGEVRPLKLEERGRVLGLTGYSGVGNLPLSIAERQRNALIEKLRSGTVGPEYTAGVELMSAPTPGQGTFVFLKAETENSLAGFTALGERGKRAELVGEEAAAEFLRYRDTGASLDPYTADQIVLYLSMCNGESVFSVSRITQHLATNLWAIRLFHEFEYSAEGEIGSPGKVVIAGNAP